MSKTDGKPIALNVRLKALNGTGVPHAANYTHVSIFQGVAYVDMGFVEPRLLGAIAKDAREGQAGPKVIEGEFVARMALGIEGLAMLHQQIQRVLIDMRKVSDRGREAAKVKSET